MRRLRRIPATLALALCAAAQDPPPLACPPGSEQRQRERDFACETPEGVGEGPFWGRYQEGGGLRYWSEARRGRTHGPWIAFHPNGRRSREAEYRDGELTGAFREWDAEGRLTVSGQHDEAGEMHGTWTRWWPGGGKKLEWEMEHGRAHGEVAGWWEHGARRFAGRREDGRRQGVWTWWDERGRETARCRYRDGVAVEGACGADAP
jgi:antitoxin component YwqK of YwqJK toxin-antitoxin module